MKKRLFALLLTLLAVFTFATGCFDEGDTSVESSESPTDYVTVTFDSDGGTEVQPVTVKRGETIACPDVVSLRSTLENPIVFVGWYLGDDEWDFGDGVTEDITLVARWKQEGRYTVPVIPEK